jgi:hypothetical protein
MVEIPGERPAGIDDGLSVVVAVAMEIAEGTAV